MGQAGWCCKQAARDHVGRYIRHDHGFVLGAFTLADFFARALSGTRSSENVSPCCWRVDSLVGGSGGYGSSWRSDFCAELSLAPLSVARDIVADRPLEKASWSSSRRPRRTRQYSSQHQLPIGGRKPASLDPFAKPRFKA